MTGPDPPMVDPTELVEITTVGVVKIVGWSEDDGGRGGPGKYVQEGLWSGCRRWMKVSETQRAKERKNLTVSVCCSLSDNLIKNIAALAIKEIGVDAELLQSVPGTRVYAEQL